MRFKNEKKDLKLYAVAGTTTVLLSFDLAKDKITGKQLVGFSIERSDKDGKLTFHNGSKHFDSLIHDATITDQKVKTQSLVQSFFWYDYTVSPGESYTYTVKPMFGSPINHQPAFANSIKITTEPLQAGMHSVYFNYGVTGSQAYATNKEFGNQPIDSLKGQVLKDALAFLGRELWTDGLLKFVAQAKGKQQKLYGAFYEFQYPDFLKAIKAAKDRGADVQIVYSNKAAQADDKKDKQGEIKKGNTSALKAAALSSIAHPRTKPSQPHNKFMILFEGEKPVQVWTGSTNISEAGIFGQCNTGHWLVDDTIAAQYFEYWKSIKDDPAMSVVSKVSTAIQADTDLAKLANGTYVFFSPRDLPTAKGATPQHLKSYAALIDAAQEMVCMVLPFNIDDVFKKVYREDKQYLRFLIFEKAAEALKVKSKDVNLKFTAGAVLDSAVENYAKEVTAARTSGAGILYVHNKFIIIDALTSDPIVITGSANFSRPSILNNDENSILVKGDLRVADIYLTEFNRLFVHFWPRYLRKLKGKNNKLGFEKPLDETYTWHLDYFDKTKFDCKRKIMFTNMQGAKQG